MANFFRWLVLAALVFCCIRPLRADARFDLTGPKIDIRVTRDAQTLPIAQVPNLQPGDKLWLHPDLPPTQSVHYLLICVFLRGTTNPPPDEWFTRIETWNKKVREEGVFVTVPAEAQQAVLFMAPETGGDFSTLRSAVKASPGVFVRAQQDLIEAGFQQARIEKYLASIRRVPPSDPAELQKHSELLARTLALKPNPDCFKQPVDMQFTCLTQAGSQTLLDDSHSQSLVTALSSGPGSDFINQASYTQLAGAGNYSAYVGALVDLVRILGNLHTAQFQYIPAIAFPQDVSLNLRLNAPPSFRNPKSVLVIGLPAVQASVPPPLRPADATFVACLLQPSVTLPIEGAPLVFSTDFAHELVLHFNPPAGAPAEPDIPLTADAYQGGLVLNRAEEHHVPLHEPLATPNPFARPDLAPAATLSTQQAPTTQPTPILVSATVRGRWGFNAFTGPVLQLQQLPGTGWHIVTPDKPADLIAGHAATLNITATGTACVHAISAHPVDAASELAIPFTADNKLAAAGIPYPLKLTLPLDHATTPGELNLAIQQFGQPKPDELSARTFAEPPHIAALELHAADKSILVTGTHLDQVASLTLGDLHFMPTPQNSSITTSLRLALPTSAPPPPTRLDEHLTANIALTDGRTINAPVVVSSPRPQLILLHKAVTTAASPITLTNADDLPLNAAIHFTLKSAAAFPRDGRIEIETLDGTLRTVLTLAPSGGLILQDPHTIVAAFDPLHSFGPSAFGALHLRSVYTSSNKPEDQSHAAENSASAPSENFMQPIASDWLPLGTLVRLPTLTQLVCPTDATQSCTLTGADFFLMDAVSTDATFTAPQPVPDGYTGNTLAVPHPSADGIFYLRLRDDPGPINAAHVPAPTPTQVTTAPAHARGNSNHASLNSSAASQQPLRQTPAPQSGVTTPTPATQQEPQTQTPHN